MPNDLVPAGSSTLPDDAARRRDAIGGVLLVVLGASVAYTATGYNVGTLTRMGPGFVPTALGVLLTLVGAVLLATTVVRFRAVLPSASAGVTVASPLVGPADTLKPEWRGWICICFGVLVFAGLAEHTGLVPATLLSVFVTALGDRENSVRDAVLLSLGMAVGATVIFWWGLGVLLPLFEWNFG